MNKLSIQIIGLVAFVAIAGAALFYGGVFDNSQETSATDNSERTARTVQVLNYSDYSCPACRAYAPFNEMHNLLYEYQEQWSARQADAREYIIGFAEEIGLDMGQFLEDLESEEIHNLVEAHREEGIRRTVNSTPSFFIDGHKLRQNPQSYEQFKSIVELYMYRD